jgi:site-specific DNA-methyltransferase (adenine-specific)
VSALPTPYYEDDAVTIYHGDCRDVLPSLTADAAIFDPPYGVDAKYGPTYSDKREAYWPWFLPALHLIRQTAPVLAFTHRTPALKEITDWDWLMAWHKPYGAGARIGNSPLLPHWEVIVLYGIHSLGTKRRPLPDWISCNPERVRAEAQNANGNGRVRWQGDEYSDHPTPKPVVLFRKLIEGLTLPGEIILDPFAGSGTTLRAAKDLGRKAIGIEIEERYCEIAAKRMAQQVLPL